MPRERERERSPTCMYQPCRLFPGEVEDYFCMDCKVPSSALALLVGPHTGHRRLPFEAALLALPQQCLEEATELHKCTEIILSTEGPLVYSKLKSEQQNAVTAIEEIDREIEALNQKKAKLRESIAEQEKTIDHYQTETLGRISCLADSAEEQVQIVRSLRDIYTHQEATANEDPAHKLNHNSNTVALSEIRRIELLLEADLRSLNHWRLEGGFHETPGNENSRQGKLCTAKDEGEATEGGEGTPIDGREDDTLIRHVLINQERLEHPSAYNYLHLRQTAATGSSGISTAARAGQEQVRSSNRAAFHQLASHNANVLSGHPHPGGTEKSLRPRLADLSVGEEIDTLTQVLMAKRKAEVSPTTTDEEYPDVSVETADPSPRSEERYVESKMKTPARSTIGKTLPQQSHHQQRPKVDRLDSRAPAVEATAAHQDSTIVSDTTSNPNATIPESSDDYVSSPKQESPSRYLRQFKRVRQCIRDALVADQQSLVTSLFHAIHELRREARLHRVTDVERAIALDEELQRLM